MNRIQWKIEENLMMLRVDIVKGKRATERILSPSVMYERHLEVQKDVYIWKIPTYYQKRVLGTNCLNVNH